MLTSEKGARAPPSLRGLNLIQVSESGPSLTSPLTQNMDVPDALSVCLRRQKPPSGTNKTRRAAVRGRLVCEDPESRVLFFRRSSCYSCRLRFTLPASLCAGFWLLIGVGLFDSFALGRGGQVKGIRGGVFIPVL